jgi:hypothetical protein
MSHFIRTAKMILRMAKIKDFPAHSFLFYCMVVRGHVPGYIPSPTYQEVLLFSNGRVVAF